MIVLYVNSDSKEELKKIASHLITHTLAIDINIHSNLTRISHNEKGELEESVRYLLSAKTKALLFEQIDKDIREMCPECMPEVYSTPIIHIDWDEANRLMRSTTPV